MEVLPAKRQEGNCTGRYSERLRDQNGEHLVNQCKSNNLETVHIFYSCALNQPEPYFLFILQITKIKVTRHRVVGDRCIWKGISCNKCLLSQSLSVLSNFNPFMHNVKFPNMLLKSCGVYTARFLQFVWPFYNIIHVRVKMQSVMVCLKENNSEIIFHLKRILKWLCDYKD